MDIKRLEMFDPLELDLWDIAELGWPLKAHIVTSSTHLIGQCKGVFY